jgi:hypothetical protein
LLLVGGLSLPSSAGAAGAQYDPNARDLVRLTTWFEGEFDNQEQVWCETEGRATVPPAARHERIHATHRRVSLPAFGTHVFYVEEFLEDDPQKISRQRLVTFESARDQGIRMRQWFFKNPKSVVGSQDAPSRLEGLTAEQVTHLPECDVFWHAHADQYIGSMREKACVLGQGPQRRYSQHDLVLSATKYWRVDRTFNLATNALVVGNPSGVPHKLNRAKRFDCTVNLYSSGYLNGPSPEDQTFHGQPIHSQGGTIKLTRTSDGKTYTLRLRDNVPVGSRRRRALHLLLPARSGRALPRFQSGLDERHMRADRAAAISRVA